LEPQAQTSESTAPSSTQKSTFDAASLKYEGCKPGQSKVVTATVTVTDQNGRSDSRSTKITINCDPPYERFPDLIFAKNDARVNACSRSILIDQVAAGASAGDYNIILIGHRAGDELETLGSSGPQLDQTRALNAAAVLVRCAKVPVSAIRIDSAGAVKNPVPTSVACPEFVAPNSEAEWYGRVEVYLVPKNGKYLPENAKHLASLPPELPVDAGCAAAGTR
jgi:flagellar motor protein MotB